jgi:acetyl esterase/lipase
MQLDPEIAAALASDALREHAKFPDLDSHDTILAVRRKRDPASEAALRLVDRTGVSTTTVRVPGVKGGPDLELRVHRSESARDNLPCLYFIHGGGMVIGASRFDDGRLLPLVRRFGCAATSIEYRLAPEVQAPHLAEDCFAGLRWLSGNAKTVGVDPKRIILGGVSGGGGLAASTAIMARDRGVELLLQWLIYPQLDDRHITPSSRVDWPTWPNRVSTGAWKAVLGDRYGTDRVTPYDAAARLEDMRGLAPAFIDVGDMEVFRDECIDYATRLIAAGVPTEFHLYPGCCHGFDAFVPDAKVSKTALATRNAALARAWNLPL